MRLFIDPETSRRRSASRIASPAAAGAKPSETWRPSAARPISVPEKLEASPITLSSIGRSSFTVIRPSTVSWPLTSDCSVPRADSHDGFFDWAAGQDCVGVRQRQVAIDLADRDRNSQLGSTRSKRQRGDKGRRDLDLDARRDIGDRQHVQAAQKLLVQDRRLAAIDRVLVGLACGRLRLRFSDQHPVADLCLDPRHHGVERNREGDRRLDWALFVVPEGADELHDGKPGRNLDVV